MNLSPVKECLCVLELLVMGLIKMKIEWKQGINIDILMRMMLRGRTILSKILKEAVRWMTWRRLPIMMVLTRLNCKSIMPLWLSKMMVAKLHLLTTRNQILMYQKLLVSSKT